MTQPTRIYDFASPPTSQPNDMTLTSAMDTTTRSKPMSIASSNSSRKSSFSDYSSSFSSTTSSTNPFSSSTLRRQSIDQPSAYVSDEDLFGDDLDEPYLSEPPQAPRSAEQWLARPLLPPVTAPLPSTKSLSKRKGLKHVKFRKTSACISG